MSTHGHSAKTEEDIYTAFRRESVAKSKYLDCAQQAEKEGYLDAAKLFRATAEAEAIHARSFLQALHEISTARVDLWAPMGGNNSNHHSTEENLRSAASESHDLSTMYDRMVQDADMEGSYWSFAKECFTYAKAVDEVHSSLFKKTLSNLDRRGSIDYHVCESCGNTIDSEPTHSCDVCGSSSTAFHRVV